MHDCPRADIRDELPALVHGRLNAAERARVEAHVVACDACHAELALLREMHAALSATPVVHVERIAAALRALPRERGAGHRPLPRRAAWRRRWGTPAALAAGLAVLAAASLLWAPLWEQRGAAGSGAARRVATAAAAHTGTPDAGQDAGGGTTALPGGMGNAPGNAGAVPGGAVAFRGARDRAPASAATGGAADETPAAPGIAVGAELAELSTSDMRLLLETIAQMESVPDSEPAPALPALDGEV